MAWRGWSDGKSGMPELPRLLCGALTGTAHGMTVEHTDELVRMRAYRICVSHIALVYDVLSGSTTKNPNTFF